jgi:hypothetical protein
VTTAKYILAALLVLFGVGFALAPDAWIEARYGVSPDGGSGWAEALFSAGPIVAGLWLAAATARTSLNRRADEAA